MVATYVNVLCREALSLYLQDACFELTAGPKYIRVLPGYDHAGLGSVPALSHYQQNAHLLFETLSSSLHFSWLFTGISFCTLILLATFHYGALCDYITGDPVQYVLSSNL